MSDLKIETSDLKSHLTFFRLLEKLKTTKRTGWVQNKVQNPESIADHMYRMAIMAFFLPNVDNSKCIKMALVHDIIESVCGDIVPHAMSKEDKRKIESEAMHQIKGMLNNSSVALEIESLWNEYEIGKSKEAIAVKDLDKFEMVLQAAEYQNKQGLELSQFFESTEGKFKTEYVQELVKLLDN